MSEYALVADVGGTNARFALVKEGSVELESVRTLQCDGYDNIDSACQAYFEQVGIEAVSRAGLAFACPVQQQEIRMTNNHWRFTRDQLSTALGLQQLKLVNDFTAMALGMLNIPSGQCLAVGGGASAENAVRLVIGPGTGLGVSGLVPSENSWVPLSTEGGHIGFAPNDDVEVAILQHLQQRFGRVSVERILCGQGLLNLYQALCSYRGAAMICNTPAQVTEHALAETELVSQEALKRFCSILGRVAGDNVLTLGARGGVYLCGGILPRFSEFFLHSGFREAFEDKGRFKAYMQQVPVWLSLAEHPGLTGAAAALWNTSVPG